jgi:hypothetical protein
VQIAWPIPPAAPVTSAIRSFSIIFFRAFFGVLSDLQPFV